MRHGARRWLIGIGAATVAGSSVLAATGSAGAAGLGARQSGSNAAVRVMAATTCSTYTPGNSTLTLGSHGAAVKALQQRLNCLHYYAGRADGHFGWSTMEAVWAFKEVQAGKIIPSNPDVVGAAMQRQLAHPKLPKVLRSRLGPWRIEINKSIEVMVLYKDNKIELISHTSTAAYYRSDGSGWSTPDGTFHALSFIPGWACGSLGCMWNPVFFITTLYAMHGEPNPPSTFSEAGVPLNPASHGCVRIPWDISQFFHRLVRTGPHGTPVYIAGPNYYGRTS
jgi:peptidoglycan hydrolase-like protein with peptidoglycan-binding domain